MADSYQESLDYLYSLQFFGIKLGLENTRELLSRIGNPQRHLRIIHIAGTNGKGSTAAALAEVFHAAAIPAGLYTSPHLHSFTERIRINGRQISEAEVVALIAELRPHAEELKTTFFEFTTALALLYFQRRKVAWVILETGMGGRLDATNVVTPELCVITPIALDHTAYLGDNLRDIAAEKAGIFKSGVPVVSSLQDPVVAAELSRRAAATDSPLVCFDIDYRYDSRAESFSVSGKGFCLDNIRPVLAGEHQQQNLALAAAAVDCLLKRQVLNFPTDFIRAGLERVRWPGRLEWLADNILLDGAHNRAGAVVLAAYLRRRKLNNLHLVIGCKADKQATVLLAELLPFVQALYVTSPPVDEAADVEKLVQMGKKSGILAASYETPRAALNSALARRRAEEVVLVAGSLFLVAAIRETVLEDFHMPLN